jgi:DNA modification methylase
MDLTNFLDPEHPPVIPKHKKRRVKTQTEKDQDRGFNGMTRYEWTMSSDDVIRMYTAPRNQAQKDHGATFPKELIMKLIREYSAPGDIALDPFLGTGTSLQACLETGRNGIGIELNPKFFAICDQIVHQPTLTALPVTLQAYNDDNRNLLWYVEPESVQCVITSPPYADLLHKMELDRATVHKVSFMGHNAKPAKPYSDDARDFGNLAYAEFLQATLDLMRLLYQVVKTDGYMVWIVKDYRDNDHGMPLVPLHADLGYVGELAGFAWADERIWDQSKDRPRMDLGFPTHYVSNLNHTDLMVFRKLTPEDQALHAQYAQSIFRLR